MALDNSAKHARANASRLAQSLVATPELPVEVQGVSQSVSPGSMSQAQATIQMAYQIR